MENPCAPVLTYFKSAPVLMISHFRHGLILSTAPTFALCGEHLIARFLVIFAE